MQKIKPSSIKISKILVTGNALLFLILYLTQFNMVLVNETTYYVYF